MTSTVNVARVKSSEASVQGLPTLPAGYTSQVAWGFRDPDNGRSYDFFRVYRPSPNSNGLGPIARIDEDLSYWQTIFWPDRESTQERPSCRWISYAQARGAQAGANLTFARFSSPLPMREHARRTAATADRSRPEEAFPFLSPIASKRP